MILRNQLQRYLVVPVTSVFFLASSPSVANDPAANFVTQLFIEVCLSYLGQPDKVRAWADQKKLPRIDNPEALRLFVGEGPKGSAWFLPSSLGTFALSIRGTTEACAAWARQANPVEVETAFGKIMEGVKRPGLAVSVATDRHIATANGNAPTLIYEIRASGQSKGYLFTLLTAEKAGGAFQISIQAAAASF